MIQRGQDQRPEGVGREKKAWEVWAPQVGNIGNTVQCEMLIFAWCDHLQGGSSPVVLCRYGWEPGM